MNNQKISELLAGSKPMAFRRLDDGGMVVINAKGQKVIFTRRQLEAAQQPTNPVNNKVKTIPPMQAPNAKPPKNQPIKN